jgi:hypothetical protein
LHVPDRTPRGDGAYEAEMCLQDRTIRLLAQSLSHRGQEDLVALDLEPDEICQHALKVVKRAERKLWLLRFKIALVKVIRGRVGLWRSLGVRRA